MIKPAWIEPKDASPLGDISGIRINPVPTSREELDPFEAENIRKALTFYFAEGGWKKFEFHIDEIMKAHQRMLGDVWDWAGKYRTTDYSIGVDKQLIRQQLEMLLADMQEWGSYEHSLNEQSARLHHRLVQIHPFVNGNGRWSRLIESIWRRQNGVPLVEWPAQIGKTSPVRDEYIAALKAADQGDLGPLQMLHKQYEAKSK